MEIDPSASNPNATTSALINGTNKITAGNSSTLATGTWGFGGISGTGAATLANTWNKVCTSQSVAGDNPCVDNALGNQIVNNVSAAGTYDYGVNFAENTNSAQPIGTYVNTILYTVVAQ
jgi:hypothetical protein